MIFHWGFTVTELIIKRFLQVNIKAHTWVSRSVRKLKDADDIMIWSFLFCRQGLKTVTIAYVFTLLLLATFISQSWSTPKVRLVWFYFFPLLNCFVTRLPKQLFIFWQYSKVRKISPALSFKYYFFYKGLIPAKKLDPAGYAVPQGHPYVSSYWHNRNRVTINIYCHHLSVCLFI